MLTSQKRTTEFPDKRSSIVWLNSDAWYLMVLAIASLYTDVMMMLGFAIIKTTIGLRQGSLSPTSCFLCTLYINGLVRRMKSGCSNDGFFRWIHCLLLMDDTVILATTTEMCIKKLTILQEFCLESGMMINRS